MWPVFGPPHVPDKGAAEPEPEPARGDGDRELTEPEAIVAWRLHELVDWYPLPLAGQLALAVYVDLHLAVELVEDGHCPPELAARILL